MDCPAAIPELALHLFHLRTSPRSFRDMNKHRYADEFVPHEYQAINQMKNRNFAQISRPAMESEIAHYPPVTELVDPQIEPEFTDYAISVKSLGSTIQMPELVLLAGMDNYVASMESFVKAEHLAELVAYERYSRYQIHLKATNNPKVSAITLPGVADSSPPVEPEDWMLIGTKEYQWTTDIKDVVRTTSTIFVFFEPRRSVNIRILPNPARQHYLLEALRSCQTWNSKDSVLFPSIQPCIRFVPPNRDFPKLNEVQREAVHQLLGRTKFASNLSLLDERQAQFIRSPFIISGPAGTGKTLTIVSVITTLVSEYPDCRILACAPSQSASDTIATCLLSTLKSKQIFRFNTATRDIKTLPVALLPICKQDVLGSFCLPSVEEFFDHNVVVCTCYEAGLLNSLGLSNRSIRQKREAAWNFLLAGSNTPTKPTDIKTHHWTHVIVDEAAQATEPITLMPINLVIDEYPVQIVLCGDTKQLGAVLISDSARKAGQGDSLMTRLLNMKLYAMAFDQQYLIHSVQLLQNYRSHSSLLMMPSALFYNDRLVASTKPSLSCSLILNSDIYKSENQDLQPIISNWPIIFHGVSSQDKHKVDENSKSAAWYNPQEAKILLNYVKQLLSENFSANDIGVVAPFRGQVAYCRKLFREAKLSAINVGTVEDYQGMERSIILASIVRTTLEAVALDQEMGMGLIYQSNRLNVLLTRPRDMLIIVGNSHILQQDPLWTQLFLFFDRNGLWKGNRNIQYGDDTFSQKGLGSIGSGKGLYVSKLEIDQRNSPAQIAAGFESAMN